MTELTRRAVVGGLAGVAVGNAHAQSDWPSRTITIMHGFRRESVRCGRAHHRQWSVEGA